MILKYRNAPLFPDRLRRTVEEAVRDASEGLPATYNLRRKYPITLNRPEEPCMLEITAASVAQGFCLQEDLSLFVSDELPDDLVFPMLARLDAAGFIEREADIVEGRQYLLLPSAVPDESMRKLAHDILL